MTESETTKKFNCPKIGLGTCNLKEIEEVVYESIKDGTRLIDTASFYKNEEKLEEELKKPSVKELLKEKIYLWLQNVGLLKKVIQKKL